MLNEMLGDDVCSPLRIYVAGPLCVAGSDGYEVDEDCVLVADQIGQELFLRGHWPIVPHTMTRSWFDRDERAFHDYDVIVASLDFAWLRVCDAIFLCDGWAHSRGAGMEAEEAERLGLWMFSDLASVPEVRPDVDGHHGLLEKRDTFSCECRRRIILGQKKHGPSWMTQDNLGEALAEAKDLENYAFLHHCQMEWRRDHATATAETPA